MVKKILNFNNDISSSSRHRASFLACKEEIFEALENGWTAKAIWTKLHDAHAFDGSYNTFCRHIRRYIKHKTSTKEGTTPQTKAHINPIKAVEPSQPKTDTSSSPSGFVYDPTRTFNLNDL